VKTIVSIIEANILQQPFLNKMLIDELINLSSLARQLKPIVESELQKNMKLGSIVMALKRLIPQLQGKEMIQANKLFKSSVELTVRSNLCIHTFENSKTMVLANRELLKKLSKEKNVFHTVSCGLYETSIVIGTQHCFVLEEIFKNEVLLISASNLSGVTINLKKEYADSPGLYHIIFSKLAWHGINVIEIISTPHEMSLIINDADTGKTYSSLKELFI